MKVTFPHMGNVYLAAKALFDGLGIDYVIPPKNNKEALDIGTLHSPEEMCLPFKLMIGNYVQAIQKGADTIIIVGSCGPCRFGEYCELQMNIMKSMGYDLNFIVIDYPKDIGIKELYRRINQISSQSSKSTIEKMRALNASLRVIRLIDEIEEAAHMFAGYERNRGDCKHTLNKCKEEALKCKTPNEMINLLISYKEKISHIPVDINKNPLKIAVIGEIYTVIEPYTNFSIEEKLMDYGVSSLRGLTPSWWVKNALMSPLKINSLTIKRNAKKYLPLSIGGHAIECVGEAVTAANEGYDGAIQIFPMGCMPEIVSKSILPTISKDLNFPIMSLVVDDMDGEAGYITRIEAFIDLLERRRESVLLRC